MRIPTGTVFLVAMLAGPPAGADADLTVEIGRPLHGNRDMPVWGRCFREGEQDQVPPELRAIIVYLATLQFPLSATD